MRVWLAVAVALATHERLASFVETMGETRTRSYVVVGAHYFAKDRNDPLYRLVRRQRWGGLGLVEASPDVARELRSKLKERRPLSVEKIIVDEACVAPTDGQLPFYVLNVSEAEILTNQLPFWTTQINSLSRNNIEKQLPRLARGSAMSALDLRARIVQIPVVCRTLQAELEHLNLPPPAIIVLDTEGADCAVVEVSAKHIVQKLTWAAQTSSLFGYENIHCTAAAKTQAERALADAAQVYAPDYSVDCRDDLDKESTFCFFEPRQSMDRRFLRRRKAA